MRENSASQNRKSSRSPVLLSATIERNGEAQPVRLRNLSAEGALVQSDAALEPGAEVLFQRNDLRVKARVVWTESGFSGVAFERPLDREEVLRHVPQPRQKVEQQYKRPGFACQPLSEADRRMVQLWATNSSSMGD